jgi:acyl carrier protein
LPGLIAGRFDTLGAQGNMEPEMTTIERIRKLLVEKLELNAELIVPDATLDSLGLDSLDKIEFIFALEDEFKIKIEDRNVRIDTIRDGVTLIERLVAEQKA